MEWKSKQDHYEEYYQMECVCSGKELGISENHDGIMELPTNFEIGKNISKTVYQLMIS